jgi:hypothetical protein
MIFSATFPHLQATDAIVQAVKLLQANGRKLWGSETVANLQEQNVGFLALSLGKFRFSSSGSVTGFSSSTLAFVGRDSVDGVATRYGLDGPGIESPWRRDFQHASRPASCALVTGSFPAVKGLGCGGSHPTPPPSNAEATEKVEPHLHSRWALGLYRDPFFYFGFPLSLSFHQCSVLIFIYTLLLPERERNEA